MITEVIKFNDLGLNVHLYTHNFEDFSTSLHASSNDPSSFKYDFDYTMERGLSDISRYRRKM